MNSRILKFKIFIPLVLFLAVLSTSYSGNSINSIEFLNPKTGLMCGDNGLIYKTINSGNNWYIVSSGTTEKLSRLFPAAKNTVVIAGSHGTILRSENSGSTWNIINSGVIENLNGIFINDDGSGFITGDNKLILKTSDFGVNWKRISGGREGRINDVSMFNKKNGVMAGDNNFILYTANGGIDWNPPSTSLSFNAGFKHVIMTGSQTAFIISDAGHIIRTTDGGNSWMLLFTNHNELALNNISQIDSITIAAAGANGEIIISYDNGLTWNSENAGTSSDLYCIHFINQKTGFAGGDDGTLIRTGDGGNSWYSVVSGLPGLPVSVLNSKINRETVLNIGSSPNPFNPSTTICYDLSFDANVSVKIYDISGKEAAVLVNNFQKAGNYRSLFNASNLASGIYFYRITAVSENASFEKTMKMILVK